MGWKHREDIVTSWFCFRNYIKELGHCGESSLYCMCKRIRQRSCKGKFLGSNVKAALPRGVFGGISRRIDMQGLTKRVEGLILDGDYSGSSGS
jgi:hypothetical protein